VLEPGVERGDTGVGGLDERAVEEDGGHAVEILGAAGPIVKGSAGAGGRR
jgi:hypothetical protein